MKTIMITALSVISGLLHGIQAQTKEITSMPDETSITYYLVHPLHKIESTSRIVSSTVRVDGSKRSIQSVTASVDVTTFDSGNSNRDSHAMEVIDAISFPEASFTSSSISVRGDSLFITGNLTFHGITHEIMMNAVELWSKKELVVHAAFEVSLTAYHVERPALLLVPVEDELRFSLSAAYAL